MEFRPRPADGASPGTDAAALRLITTAVVAGLIISGLATASWRGLMINGVARYRPAAARPARPTTYGQAQPIQAGPTRDRAAGLRLLAQSAQACRSLAYQGVEVAWWGPGGGDTSTVDVWHQPGGQALTQVARASVQWPSRPHQAVPLALPGATDLNEASVLGMSTRLVALMGANYVVKVTGWGRVAGRMARVVAVRRRDGSLAAWLWLDSATSLPLRKEMFDTRARLISDISFAEVSIGPGAVGGEPGQVAPMAVAWRTTLAAAQLTRLRARGWPLPGPLPGHLTLIAAKESTTSSGPVIDLDYSDGLSVVSIFVQRGYVSARLSGWSRVALEGHQVYADDPDHLCFAWSARGFVYTLIAAAPRQTVSQVVAALPHDDGGGLLSRMKQGLHQLLSWLSP
jgi:sigma-E factor negative regulatory protein RseB